MAVKKSKSKSAHESGRPARRSDGRMDLRDDASAKVVFPHLALVKAPSGAFTPPPLEGPVRVATYNVHRWSGVNGRTPDPARAGFVISEIGADVIALQEVLRPFSGPCPLEALAEALGLHVVFAVTRRHKRGQLGNAILSRWPIASVSMFDLSYTRMEKRLALSTLFEYDGGTLGVVATHLALSDRTRARQVNFLLEHPSLRSGPVVLLGDMNAWRNCKATRALEDALDSHHNQRWPASFPAPRPVLALDRMYSHGVDLTRVEAFTSPAARRASDHLPVVATLDLPKRAEPATIDQIPATTG